MIPSADLSTFHHGLLLLLAWTIFFRSNPANCLGTGIGRCAETRKKVGGEWDQVQRKKEIESRLQHIRGAARGSATAVVSQRHTIKGETWVASLAPQKTLDDLEISFSSALLFARMKGCYSTEEAVKDRPGPASRLQNREDLPIPLN